jgi:hypothetical protein
MQGIRTFRFLYSNIFLINHAHAAFEQEKMQSCHFSFIYVFSRIFNSQILTKFRCNSRHALWTKTLHK